MKVTLFTDGGARGNPGPGAAGVHVIAKSETSDITQEYFLGFFLGYVTNNQAEYLALIAGLDAIKKLLNLKDLNSVEVKLDSELLVKQLNGIYKVKDPSLQKLYKKVQQLIKNDFPMIQFNHLSRANNQKADFLVNQVLDLQNGISQIN